MSIFKVAYIFKFKDRKRAKGYTIGNNGKNNDNLQINNI